MPPLRMPLLASALAALLIGSLADSTPAYAQTPHEVAAARRAFREGEDAEQRGDLAVALEKFKEARAVKATPQLELRVGAIEEKLGRYVEALSSYEHGLEKASGLPAVAKVARELADGLRPRVPTVTITISNPPSDLVVALDGAPVSPTDMRSLRVDPGPHRVHAQAAGFLPRDQSFTATERGRARIAMDLLAATPAPPPPEPDTTSSPSSKLRGALLLSGGIVLTAVGLGLLGDSYAKDGTINTECGGSARLRCPLASKSTIESQASTVNAFRGSGVALSLAGAAVVATGIYFLVRAPSTPPSSASSPWHVVPSASAEGGALTLLGAF